MIRLQCYEGLDVAHAVYEWNYARQLLHIRAAQEGTVDESELFGPEFLIRRPLLEAIEAEEPVVLLIDEIDRADEEFEAFLLEVLSDFQITIPEIGTIEAKQRPYVILTSNRTRELHDALKRRCLFHWIGHPSLEREIEIVKLRVPGVPERLAAEAAAFVAGLRQLDLQKPPGRRGDDRLGAGAGGARPAGARRRGRREDARRGAQVPRGLALRPRRDAGRARRRARRAPASAVVRHIVTFGRVLREAGLEVGPGRVSDALAGLDAVELARQDDVYWTLRRRSSRGARSSTRSTARSTRGSSARPCSRRPPRSRRRSARRAPQGSPARPRARRSTAATTSSEPGARTRCCATKDFAAMTPEEFARARKLIQAIAVARPQRRSRRLRRDRRGHALDMRGLVRASLATGGDPVERASAAARRRRASSCCSATSRARWRRTRGRCCSTCTRRSDRAAASRRSRSARG